MIIFRKKVFAMLKENNRISDGLIEKMISWNHSGFSVELIPLFQYSNIPLFQL
ncbi:MAG: hypothetical protein GTO45_10365 [Candidatus Aminicenantes bacterium]|nr:hypothetical protein [Candidatus Aminicenantes bacterium]